MGHFSAEKPLFHVTMPDQKQSGPRQTASATQDDQIFLQKKENLILKMLYHEVIHIGFLTKQTQQLTHQSVVDTMCMIISDMK